MLPMGAVTLRQGTWHSWSGWDGCSQPVSPGVFLVGMLQFLVLLVGLAARELLGSSDQGASGCAVGHKGSNLYRSPGKEHPEGQAEKWAVTAGTWWIAAAGLSGCGEEISSPCLRQQCSALHRDRAWRGVKLLSGLFLVYSLFHHSFFHPKASPTAGGVWWWQGFAVVVWEVLVQMRWYR